jgi:hypothetical protein
MLNESKFRELHHRQQESGLTVREFCSNEGIPESTFYYWRKKLHKTRVTSKGFIPLIVKSPPSLLAPSYPKRGHAISGNGEIDDALLELVYANGTKLRIKNDIDLNRLRSLISLND